MMQTPTINSLGYFVALLVLVALTFAVDRLGLMLWVAWLNRCEGKHEASMRSTVALDDDLAHIAQQLTGVTEKVALLREALKALIERESARRLASLGGTMPGLKNIPRRRSGKAE